MRQRSRFRLGLRNEVLLLLPLATLLLVLLATFVLFSFRHGLNLLVEQRRTLALSTARTVAFELTQGTLPSAAGLHRLAPSAQRIALIDQQGELIVASGDFTGLELLAPWPIDVAADGATAGPIEPVLGSISCISRLQRDGTDFFLRLDLAAPELARQLQTVRTLTVVVLLLSFLVSLVVFFFLRHVLRPYDTLLHTAREVQIEPTPADSDEIEFLVSTFQRALASIHQPVQEEVEDDIAALQRALTPSLESGVLLLDHRGSILALNSLGASLLALEDMAFPAGLEETLALHPELLQLLKDAVSEERGAKRLEATIEVRDEMRTLGLAVHALRRDDSSVRGYLALFTDLTELRQRSEEERLSETLNQLGELAAGIAHELRNGIATLRGYLTLIERSPDEESITDYLVEIRRESDHLERVLGDFLLFARPESLRIDAIDLLHLVRRVAADPVLDTVEIEISSPSRAPRRVLGDEQLLELVIRNLLRNAVEATEAVRAAAPEPVTITIQNVGEQLELAIGDRGPGLPGEPGERFFQPFFSTKTEGVGLGLSIVKRIAILHGLGMRLENRDGGGTRAILTFPPDTFAT